MVNPDIAKYAAEFVGTMILIWLGDGVVACALLPKSKGEILSQGSKWFLIITGWAFAVVFGVYASFKISGGHINPAVTIALAVYGKFPWRLVPGYIIAQIAGAFCGAILVYLTYLAHFQIAVKEGLDPVALRAIFCTVPQIRHIPKNLLTEILGTAMLLLGVGFVCDPHVNLGSMIPFLVGVLVWGIGASLGGPTGFAINPARDFGARLAHAVLPIPGKTDSDWEYGLIVPIIGPIIGGIIGYGVYLILAPFIL